MKRILILFLLTGGIFSAAGQIYVPGEELFYRVSYRAKLVPNTEVATVVVRTSEVELDGQTVYNVFGQGKTLASFRWFFSLDDRYNIWVDTATLRTVRFTSDIHEGGYTFRSRFDYDWPARRVARRWPPPPDGAIRSAAVGRSVRPGSTVVSVRLTGAPSAMTPTSKRRFAIVRSRNCRRGLPVNIPGRSGFGRRAGATLPTSGRRSTTAEVSRSWPGCSAAVPKRSPLSDATSCAFSSWPSLSEL